MNLKFENRNLTIFAKNKILTSCEHGKVKHNQVSVFDLKYLENKVK